MKIKHEIYDFVAYDDDGQKILTVATREVEGDSDEPDYCIITGIISHGRDNALELDAFVRVCYFIAGMEEFNYNYPSIDNLFEQQDNYEVRLISQAIEKGRIPEQMFMDLEGSFAKAKLQYQEVRKSLAGLTSAQSGATTRTGFVSSTPIEVLRSPRDFSNERVPQLLRQISTQLYHFCRANKVNPTEVQMMYFDNSIFIAANTNESIEFLRRTLTNAEEFRNALITPYSYARSKEVDKKISKRHASKINARVYLDAFDFEDQRANVIKKLVREYIVADLNVPDLKDSSIAPAIYFVTDSKRPELHAEENLLDVLKYYYPDLSDEAELPAIFGKKRPCFSCHASLGKVESTWADEGLNKPFEFNPLPGLFFKGSFYEQSLSSAEATAEALASSTRTTYVSVVGGAGYATCSDSEAEGSELEVAPVAASSSTRSSRGKLRR